MAERIITRGEFANRLAVSTPTLDRREAEALARAEQAAATGAPIPEGERFPRRRRLGHGLAGRIGYLESEVDAFLRALPVGGLGERTAAARAARHGVNGEAASTDRV